MQKNGDAHKLAKLFNKSEQTEADDPKEKEVIVQFADPDSADLSKTEADKIETVQTMGLEDTGAKGSKEIEIASGITVSSDEVSHVHCIFQFSFIIHVVEDHHGCHQHGDLARLHLALRMLLNDLLAGGPGHDYV